MSDRPIITVSVAAYNAEKYIREALLPFCDKKYRGKIEVLVIDDGDCFRILSGLRKSYARNIQEYSESFTRTMVDGDLQ